VSEERYVDSGLDAIAMVDASLEDTVLSWVFVSASMVIVGSLVTVLRTLPKSNPAYLGPTDEERAARARRAQLSPDTVSPYFPLHDQAPGPRLVYVPLQEAPHRPRPAPASLNFYHEAGEAYDMARRARLSPDTVSPYFALHDEAPRTEREVNLTMPCRPGELGPERDDSDDYPRTEREACLSMPLRRR